MCGSILFGSKHVRSCSGAAYMFGFEEVKKLRWGSSYVGVCTWELILVTVVLSVWGWVWEVEMWGHEIKGCGWLDPHIRELLLYRVPLFEEMQLFFTWYVAGEGCGQEDDSQGIEGDCRREKSRNFSRIIYVWTFDCRYVSSPEISHRHLASGLSLSATSCRKRTFLGRLLTRPK